MSSMFLKENGLCLWCQLELSTLGFIKFLSCEKEDNKEKNKRKAGFLNAAATKKEVKIINLGMVVLL